MYILLTTKLIASSLKTDIELGPLTMNGVLLSERVA